jgi:hypothetical protein
VDLDIVLGQRTAISGFFLPFVFSQPVISTSFFPASTFVVVLYLLHYFTFFFFHDFSSGLGSHHGFW